MNRMPPVENKRPPPTQPFPRKTYKLKITLQTLINEEGDQPKEGDVVYDGAYPGLDSKRFIAGPLELSSSIPNQHVVTLRDPRYDQHSPDHWVKTLANFCYLYRLGVIVDQTPS